MLDNKETYLQNVFCNFLTLNRVPKPLQHVFSNFLTLDRCSLRRFPSKILTKCFFQFGSSRPVFLESPQQDPYKCFCCNFLTLSQISVIALPQEMQTSKTGSVPKWFLCKWLKVSLFVREISTRMFYRLLLRLVNVHLKKTH